MTRSEARLLDLINTRPRLAMVGSAKSTVWILDLDDHHFQARTTESVLDRLARRGMFPAVDATDGSTVYADLDAFNAGRS